MAGFLSYHRIVFRRAWREAIGFAQRHLVGTIIATLGAFSALPLVARLSGSLAIKQGAIDLLFGAIGTVFLFAGAFVLFWIRAGSQIFDENQAKILSLEDRLRPRLGFSLPKGNGLTEVNTGHTSESLSGFRQTVLGSRDDLVCLHVRNESERHAKSVAAKLIEAWAVQPFGPPRNLGIVESIALGWSRDLAQFRAHVNLDPEEAARLYVARVAPSGAMALYKSVSETPIEYHQMFSNPGHYRLLIYVSANKGPSSRVFLDVETRQSPLIPNRVPTATAEVRILETEFLREDTA